MELIKIVRILWIVNFFFFALTLIFIWSKILIIAKKVKVITVLIRQSEVTVNEARQLDKSLQSISLPPKEDE